MQLSLSGRKVPGIIRSRERKFHGTFVPGSESSMEKFLGAKVPVTLQNNTLINKFRKMYERTFYWVFLV